MQTLTSIYIVTTARVRPVRGTAASTGAIAAGHRQLRLRKQLEAAQREGGECSVFVGCWEGMSERRERRREPEGGVSVR
jgi:hypothetical protein